MADYEVKALTPDTWGAFAALAEKHNGVWGGCWCTYFHPSIPDRAPGAEGSRLMKQRLVHDGVAHAALVFDGEAAVAWAEYGTPDELPNLQHRKQYEAGLERPPDFRITCFFVGNVRDLPPGARHGLIRTSPKRSSKLEEAWLRLRVVRRSRTMSAPAL